MGLAEVQPLVWGGSVLAARASRRVAEALRAASGRAALAADADALLPILEAVAPRDPFADPFEDAVSADRRPCLVLLDDGNTDEPDPVRSHPPGRRGGAQRHPGLHHRALAGLRRGALRHLAADRNVRGGVSVGRTRPHPALLVVDACREPCQLVLAYGRDLELAGSRTAVALPTVSDSESVILGSLSVWQDRTRECRGWDQGRHRRLAGQHVHRGDEVRGLRLDRRVVDAGRGDPLGGRLR